MSETGSLPELFSKGVVTDIVVINYFTALGRFGLLARILGGSVLVPAAVYDPEDVEISEEGPALSELERGRRRHQRIARDPDTDPLVRERSQAALPHFEALSDHARTGLLRVVRLTDEELRVYAELRDRATLRVRYGRSAALGRGEAAALAIAEARALRLATDDQDCIRVATARNPEFRPLRIRGLLLAAVEHEMIGMSEARSIHLSMVGSGFWDTGRL